MPCSAGNICTRSPSHITSHQGVHAGQEPVEVRTDTDLPHSAAQQCNAASGQSKSSKRPHSELCARWFAAAKSGHVPSLQRALQDDSALLVLKGTGVGHTALHWSAAGGHLDAVKWLITAGLDSTTLNAVGSTPLHAAAAYGHTDVVQVLLDQPGCDTEIVNDDGETALQACSPISPV
jgi:ankyrin repeat protein